MAHKGTVVSWYSRKGYGFIKCKDYDEDLFVHVSGFGGGELIEGKSVSFEVEDDRGGKKRCVHVKGEAVDPNREDKQSSRRDGDRDDRDRRDSKRDRPSDRDYDRDNGRDRRENRRDSRDRRRD
ncbi:hypothetical protein DIPPA_09230 [Diplonema papillatum]|nr:hypothetical protein DIPPA_09230 [Diplonema papillatum]|eukprot:gene5393-8232_t